VCSSLRTTDQTSYPYKTVGKIAVSYIYFTLTFLGRRREDTRFWTEWWEAFPELHIHLPHLEVVFFIRNLRTSHTVATCDPLKTLWATEWGQLILIFLRFEIHTAVKTSIEVFWVVTPCSLVDGSGATLKMEVIRSSEMLVTTYEYMMSHPRKPQSKILYWSSGL
jgi:hypothetical protein